ncbi:MAG: hypothetical protein WD768_11715 [Phycisphaeraceae bacterium]
MPNVVKFLAKFHRDTRAGAMEYMLILATIVLPLWLMWPVYHRFVKLYGYWFLNLVNLPFP